MHIDKKQLYNQILKPTLVMACICIVVTLALSVTNSVTAPKIASLTEKQQKQAMSQLIDANNYEELTLSTDEGEITYWRATLNGSLVGYVFVTSASGYGGEVSVMTAVDGTGTVSAVSILDVSNETPGLGQNAAREDFYSQLVGKSGELAAVKHGTAAAENEIDAVTGATITSRAVVKAVNTAKGYADDLLTMTDTVLSSPEGEAVDPNPEETEVQAGEE